jgi:hypothetical protein
MEQSVDFSGWKNLGGCVKNCHFYCTAYAAASKPFRLETAPNRTAWMLIEPIHDLDVVLHQQNPPGRYERCGLDFVQSRHPQTPYRIQPHGCQYDINLDLEAIPRPGSHDLPA